MEEGSEFVERFTHKSRYRWPMFTSCCPSWVRFLRSQYPDYVSSLSTAKSPQQMFGAVAKSYFAEKMGLDPHKIMVVSMMPCTAKKAECTLPEMTSACGDPDVDVVLTTREMCRLFRSDCIVPTELPEMEFDSPLGTGTGAAVIFGTTGGVMDAALRGAYHMVTGKNPDADAFREIRGSKPWKEAVFTIPGAGEVRVMACPGGCAGGGGQPIHEGQEMAAVRGDRLWKLDADAELRFSHENPEVQALYKEYLKKPLGERSLQLLHTERER